MPIAVLGLVQDVEGLEAVERYYAQDATCLSSVPLGDIQLCWSLEQSPRMMGGSLVFEDRVLINKKGWLGWARPGLGTTHVTEVQPKSGLR